MLMFCKTGFCLLRNFRFCWKKRECISGWSASYTVGENGSVIGFSLAVNGSFAFGSGLKIIGYFIDRWLN
jgi:hypothetical protein